MARSGTRNALEPYNQMKGATSSGKFMKLVRFGMFVNVVFIVPISPLPNGQLAGYLDTYPSRMPCRCICT
jgi:hypothetical protein